MNFYTSLNAQYLCWEETCCLNWGHKDLSPHERPTVRVGSTTYLLFLLVTPQDEWRLHDLLEGKPGGLNSEERELNIFPEVWAEDNHHHRSPPPPGLQNKSRW